MAQSKNNLSTPKSRKGIGTRITGWLYHHISPLFSLFLMFCLLFIVLNVLGLILIGVVTTSSMEPVSPLGSLTLFVKQGSYSVGDIIAFNVQGCLVMHRIVQIAPNAIYTKGDKNSDIDPWILPENAIYGRLVISIPLLGYLFTFLRAPMMIAAVGTAIFIMVTWKYFGRKTTEEPEPPLPKA